MSTTQLMEGQRARRRRGPAKPAAQPPAGDAVLEPVAGIVDVADNHGYVRVNGYLPSPDDAYLSGGALRRYGLRRGDEITGAVQPNGERHAPLVRLDTVNGRDPETAKRRPEFGALTALYPQERLRLSTSPERLTTRVIDLVMPLGKGQRALVVSPPKAGKTTVLKEIAHAVAANNPEVHLMVVLVGERPEEVTDMKRSVRGEVVASTFDRSPSDQTAVAELAVERAMRLVELGRDVVILLDSMTRLGRAYNLAAKVSGRVLTGGIDSSALAPAKRLLGAARNVEDGGSLTVVATALVDTGSAGDNFLFEEFKGTGNAELRLDRRIAERRVYPAIDVIASGTRKDELLLGPQELAAVQRVRRALAATDPQQAIDQLLDRLRGSRSNLEFLAQVTRAS
jgi:transcription termination factor Rho